MSSFDLLAGRDLNRTAVRFVEADDGVKNSTCLSYGQLQRAVDRYIAYLDLHLGLDKKRLVFILCRNGLASLVAYLACLKSGQVALLLPAQLGSVRIQALLDGYGPNALVWPEYDQALQVPRTQFVSNEALDLHPDLALLLSTSGSTGSPKQVRLSATNIAANAQAICQYLPIEAEDQVVTTLPMHYSYGLSVINTHLLTGATLVLNEHPVTSRHFWDAFRQYKSRSFNGVPVHYQTLRQLRIDRMELPSLRYLTQAGGRLDPALAVFFGKWCAETERDMYLMYGQTEATARMAYLAPEQLMLKPDSIGKAIAGGSFSLLDNQGKQLDEQGLVGELCYTGPNVMLGYAHSLHDLAKGRELECLRTGDLARRDEQGDYYIVGRKSRFIKLDGHRIDLDCLQQELIANLAYKEIACVSVDEKLLVCIETRSTSHKHHDDAKKDSVNPSNMLALKELKAGIRQYMADTGVIRQRHYRIELVTRLPRTESGKLAYAMLEQKLSQQNAAQQP